MFKSRAVAKVNPSNAYRTVLILGMGNGFLTNLLLTSLKSLIMHTVWSVLGIINDGDTHSDAGWNSITPGSHNLFTSLIVVCVHIFGTGYGLPWYGFASSFSSKETGSVFQSSRVPSNSSSKTCSCLGDWGVVQWHPPLLGGLPVHS